MSGAMVCRKLESFSQCLFGCIYVMDISVLSVKSRWNGLVYSILWDGRNIFTGKVSPYLYHNVVLTMWLWQHPNWCGWVEGVCQLWITTSMNLTEHYSCLQQASVWSDSLYISALLFWIFQLTGVDSQQWVCYTHEVACFTINLIAISISKIWLLLVT